MIYGDLVWRSTMQVEVSGHLGGGTTRVPIFHGPSFDCPACLSYVCASALFTIAIPLQSILYITRLTCSIFEKYFMALSSCLRVGLMWTSTLCTQNTWQSSSEYPLMYSIATWGFKVLSFTPLVLSLLVSTFCLGGSKAHWRYPQFPSTLLTCSISSFLSSSYSVMMVLALWWRICTTLSLWSRDWFEEKLRHWFVWVAFQLIVTLSNAWSFSHCICVEVTLGHCSPPFQW